MASNGFVSVEATGIYEGTLLEDMITTVAREKRLVCDVDIPDVFGKDFKHPYVHVPLWAFSLPLRKGDKVKVIFNQGDYLYPVLYKDPEDIDENFYKKFEFEGGNLPNTKDTVSALRLGKESFVIKTDEYTIVRDNNSFILLQEDNAFINAKNVQVVAEKFTVVDPSDTTKDLYQILKQTLDILNTRLTTQGSPASHTVVPNQFTTQIKALNDLMGPGGI